MSVQTSFEPAADTAVRSESRQTWTGRKVEQQVKGLGGGGGVGGEQSLQAQMEE